MPMQLGNLKLDGPLVLAPMTGITDLPFRSVCREMGAAMTWTEMASAEGLVRRSQRTLQLLLSDGSDRPLAVQLFGSSADTLARAALICQEMGADCVDLNMGCPVPKVVSTGAGAALLKDLSLARAILKAMRSSLEIPFTVKIRSGWTSQDQLLLDVARMAVDCGVDAITLHPRARSDTYAKPARWELIGLLARHCPITVIGNGDVRTPQDALAMLGQTGCGGVMVGRAAVGNPWIFSQSSALLRGEAIPTRPDPEEIWRVVELHLDAIASHYGHKGGLSRARLHVSRYTKGLAGSPRVRRDVNSAKSLTELKRILKDFLQDRPPLLVAGSV
ncbi:MAG: tRNA dihydrouridine synthase DusB [Thermodesulfobacteriota bacterium]